MNHILIPLAIATLASGALLTVAGGVLLKFAEQVPRAVGRLVLWVGLGALIVGVLLYIWPIFFIFTFRPA